MTCIFLQTVDSLSPNQDVGHLVQNALLAFDKAFTGKSGEINIYGRRIKFKAKWRFHSFKEPIVWDATAQDMESGIKVEEKHHDTDRDASKFAVEKLCKELKSKGILATPKCEREFSAAGEGTSTMTSTTGSFNLILITTST